MGVKEVISIGPHGLELTLAFYFQLSFEIHYFLERERKEDKEKLTFLHNPENNISFFEICQILFSHFGGLNGSQRSNFIISNFLAICQAKCIKKTGKKSVSKVSFWIFQHLLIKKVG